VEAMPSDILNEFQQEMVRVFGTFLDGPGMVGPVLNVFLNEFLPYLQSFENCAFFLSFIKLFPSHKLSVEGLRELAFSGVFLKEATIYSNEALNLLIPKDECLSEVLTEASKFPCLFTEIICRLDDLLMFLNDSIIVSVTRSLQALLSVLSTGIHSGLCRCWSSRFV
jgi:hypothetical protein